MALMSGCDVAVMGRSPAGQNSGAPMGRPTGWSSSWPIRQRRRMALI